MANSSVVPHDFEQWLKAHVAELHTVLPIPGDAGKRRYFRVSCYNSPSRVGVISPNTSENNAAFIAVSQALLARGLCCADIQVLGHDNQWMLLQDLGEQTYFKILKRSNAHYLYKKALENLVVLHKITDVPGYKIPCYSPELLAQELEYFTDWFLDRLLTVKIPTTVAASFKTLTGQIHEAFVQQPQVLVHRDYHSRNLLLQADGSCGIIDFQDAVFGPVTYDLVSLLQDSYIGWPEHLRVQWSEFHKRKLLACGTLAVNSLPNWDRWLLLTGMARNLKAIGIFARLKLRDAKPDYLHDIPRTLSYVIAACQKLSEPTLAEFFIDKVAPAMEQKLICKP